MKANLINLSDLVCLIMEPLSKDQYYVIKIQRKWDMKTANAKQGVKANSGPGLWMLCPV